ncbi:Transposase [Cordylochernes scorpioides]|uniref:Transposase n=1 Tax=Cordylochernes scorpioides TaxID=51811 RepID=A0ABY6K3N4_9ARAC|nr:Transposase [Cordylochernes scorpioides]
MESNQDTIGVKDDDQPERQEMTEAEETGPLAAAISQIATALAQGRSGTPGADLPVFDGTYSASQFFQTFDRKMEDASMEEKEKLLRLPNYLVRQPLELFRKLRLADRSYFQVRQILLDLYPESSEASFAKYFAMKLTGQANLETYYREKTAMGLQLGLPQEVILETLTEGLPFSDQRLVRVVPPENLGEWFRLVQRIHGPSVPTTRHREDQPPIMSGPYHNTPRRPGAWNAPLPPTNYTIAGFAKYGNTKIYLHVVVDHFSRYAWTFPSKSTSITTYQQVLKVVFSDESRFCLSSDSRRVRVWRRRGERCNPAAIVERPTMRQRGIMVWGAIAYDSRSPLLRIQGTMTAQRYVDDVLRPVTLPHLQGVPNALYQQDNAPPHTARISQQALQDVQILPWPPYSPDRSPIEHVWDIIGRRLHALPQPRSEDELWQMAMVIMVGKSRQPPLLRVHHMSTRLIVALSMVQAMVIMAMVIMAMVIMAMVIMAMVIMVGRRKRLLLLPW